MTDTIIEIPTIASDIIETTIASDIIETTVIIISDIIEVAERGLPGRDGTGASVTFTYNSPTASNSWLIVHNQNRYPSVTVIDGAGHYVFADVIYLDANIVQVNFAYPTSGSAYLN